MYDSLTGFDIRDNLNEIHRRYRMTQPIQIPDLSQDEIENRFIEQQIRKANQHEDFK